MNGIHLTSTLTVMVLVVYVNGFEICVLILILQVCPTLLSFTSLLVEFFVSPLGPSHTIKEGK